MSQIIIQTCCTLHIYKFDVHLCCRFLSHSELAPLRVPLVPMEHCTSRFFQECDADKDKQVSFKEWTSCFGIKNGKSNSVSSAYGKILTSNTFLNIVNGFTLWLCHHPHVSNVTTNNFSIITERGEVSNLTGIHDIYLIMTLFIWVYSFYIFAFI